ncbi:DUF5946 family protein [Gimesia aquarii]|uniref:Uncharacterized protein n=1 Tax=Gimesia aquarii TaxID=2527964 RepID=A0A517VTL8_9PLAN|nr:DUF5946 family protein [Gimesia aquarii]QDT96346.1 hypothetical protein V144x_18000 [Gimesia aquarii]
MAKQKGLLVPKSTKTPYKERQCPGCRLRMPANTAAAYDGYYHCSPECWSIYSEVLGTQFSNAIIFGQIHQMTVDAYALQHAGGSHKNKSITIHLAGLHAAYNLGIPQTQIPRLLQRLANHIQHWPYYVPPQSTGPLTAFDIALASTMEEHILRVKKWADFVWDAWSDHHTKIASLVSSHLH